MQSTPANISFTVCSVSIPTSGKGTLTLFYKNTLPSLLVPVWLALPPSSQVWHQSQICTMTAFHPLRPWSLVQK